MSREFLRSMLDGGLLETFSPVILNGAESLEDERRYDKVGCNRSASGEHPGSQER